MKTQISRDSFLAAKRYSGVYQQQGRMITDADWNELSDLAKQRLQDALLNAIGSGAPRDDSHAGLALGWTMDSNKNLMLWPGFSTSTGLQPALRELRAFPSRTTVSLIFQSRPLCRRIACSTPMSGSVR